MSSEETVRRNVEATIAHSNETRKMLRELENKLNLVEVLTRKCEILEEQVASMQVKLYSGGSTS